MQYREQLIENVENRTSTFGGWKEICRPTIALLVKKCMHVVKENQRLGFVTMRFGAMRPRSPPLFFHAFSRRVGHLYFSASGMLRVRSVTHTDRTQHTAHTACSKWQPRTTQHQLRQAEGLPNDPVWCAIGQTHCRQPFCMRLGFPS